VLIKTASALLARKGIALRRVRIWVIQVVAVALAISLVPSVSVAAPSVASVQREVDRLRTLAAEKYESANEANIRIKALEKEMQVLQGREVVLRKDLDAASSVEDTMNRLRKTVDENNYPEMATFTTMLDRQLGQLIESAERASTGGKSGSDFGMVREIARIAIKEQMSKVSMKGLSEIKRLSYGGTRKKIKNKRSKSNKK
jgi:hypothetical protein